MHILRNKKRFTFILTAVLLIAGAFLIGPSAHAYSVSEFVGDLFGILISAIGLIIVLLIKVLIIIAQYSDFVNSDAVINGWIIVRDICNMFFVVILLIIAFGTILRLENYSFKKTLPKLMLMAILINFSKTICGVLIDVAQVIMLTFVNAFKEVGGGNLVDMLGLNDVLTLAKKAEVDWWEVVGAYTLGLIYVIIAMIVIATMVAVLAMRMVMIWIYVVLSPLAYLLAAFPGGQKYSSQWWSQFTKNLIVGPVLAFFIWLSFTSMQNFDIANKVQDGQTIDVASSLEEAGMDASIGTKASSPDIFIKFIISIGMLIAGLKISQEIGGEAGGLAGKGMSAINKGQGMVFGGSGKLGRKIFKGAGTVAKQPFSWGADKLHEKTGVDLKLGRAWNEAKRKRDENRQKRYIMGKTAAQKAMEEGGRVHGVLAMTGNADDAWQQMTSWKGIRKRLRGGESMAKKRRKLIPGLQEAQGSLNDTKFQLDYLESSDIGKKEINKALDSKIKLKDAQIQQELIKPKKDRDPVFEKQLRDERQALKKKKFWTQSTDANKTKAEQQAMIPELEKEYKKQEIIANAKQKKLNKYIPESHFEARAAEQSLVSAEGAKIKDISDPTELLRMLQDAIGSHDKTLVKAIMLKMTKDYNDNEFLQPLAGRTDHVGLKTLMRDLSDKDSDNYAGFGQQEAFALGSQIAELNKNTNHWAATSAYVMENGAFRETTDEEHFEIRNIETGKLQQQKLSRDANRLAYGYHDKTGKFHIDLGGIMLMQKFDSTDGHGNMRTMNESAAKHVYDAIMSNKRLKQIYSTRKSEVADNKTLQKALEDRLGSVANSNFHEDLSYAMDVSDDS